MATTGETVSFRELDERSNQAANLFQARGLHHGDSIAIFLENHVRYLEVAWAAQRSGLYFTAVNSHLTAEEAAYIVDDCGAKVLVSSRELAAVATDVQKMTPKVTTFLMVDGAVDGWESFEDVAGAEATTPVPDECEGDFMLYSS